MIDIKKSLELLGITKTNNGTSIGSESFVTLLISEG